MIFVSVPATAIVQGDVIELEPGDLVSADSRIIEAAFNFDVSNQFSPVNRLLLKNKQPI